MITLSDAGHFMWLDKPAEFNLTVLDFLKTVSVEENESDYLNRVRIYPNPTQSFITINSGHSLHQTIDISTLNGQLILSKEMFEDTHKLDLSSL